MSDVAASPEAKTTPLTENAAAIAAEREETVAQEAKMHGLHDEADKKAYSIIDQMLDPIETDQAENSVAPTDGEPETSDDTAPDTVNEAEESEPEIEEAEDQSALPDEFTLEDLATSYEVAPDELAERLKVKVGDELVSLKDAVNGGLRQSDYTQKSTALAEDRKSFEDETGMVRNHLANQLQQAEEALIVAQQLYPNIDMAQYGHMLDEDSDHYDPAGYLRLEQQNTQTQGYIAQIRDAVEGNRKTADGEYQQQLSDWRDSQIQQLKVLKPELQDTKKAQEIEQGWKNYLIEGAGFSADEVAQYFGGPFNAKHMMLVDKAQAYDAMVAGKGKIAKKLASKPRVVKSGATATAGSDRSKQLQKARQRLRQTGSDDAALALIDAKL